MEVEAPLGEGTGTVLQPHEDHHKGGHSGDQGGHESSGGGGAQDVDGDHVLDGGGAGAVHRPGPAAGGDGGRDQAPGQVGRTEHLKGDGIDHEEYHKSGDAAVGQQAGDTHDDGGHELALAHAGQPLGDGFGGTGKLVDGAEDGAHEEYQEIAGDVVGRGRHELRLQTVQDGNILSREDGGEDQHKTGDQRSQDQCGDASEGQHTEQNDGDK